MRPEHTLFNACLKVWQHDAWRVVHHTRRPVGDRQLLATSDDRTRVLHLYPHDRWHPVERSGLHEMLHVYLALSDEYADEAAAFLLEESVWRDLTKAQRATLTRLFHP